MAKTRIFTVRFRRRLQGKTDYRKRLKLLSTKDPRLIVRKTLNHIIAQVAEYSQKGDKIIISAHSSELKKLGWKSPTGNIPSAYLLGLLLAKKIKKAGIQRVILDSGLSTSVNGSRIYAVVKGLVESGIKIPHSPEVLPDDSRVSGKHIADYASKLKKEEIEKRFSSYIKNNLDPLKIHSHAAELKQSIIGGKNG
jgi:large subunit ribosomal protein L18